MTVRRAAPETTQQYDDSEDIIEAFAVNLCFALAAATACFSFLRLRRQRWETPDRHILNRGDAQKVSLQLQATLDERAIVDRKEQVLKSGMEEALRRARGEGAADPPDPPWTPEELGELDAEFDAITERLRERERAIDHATWRTRQRKEAMLRVAVRAEWVFLVLSLICTVIAGYYAYTMP
ncbi:hypothetical protein [Streptomonospora litoralis]|uniref:Transmembrane protein n=1 Tax=Streptomonospora litoralis TaxID=2498135 RepID=A0A4P6QA33_9ACTN|nr:hypothetical protein [Streptomonospora litoralis]QBI56329.1 hypothetical protein EKD16_22880 [Streptomonospora litoralis]